MKLFQIKEPDGAPPNRQEPGAAIGIDAGGARADIAFSVEGARMRAERALARPVTHAVVVLAVAPSAAAERRLRKAAEQAGLEVLRFAGRGEFSADPTPAHGAAILAEDLAPRPELAAAPDPG